ncbi:hypothetical protein PHYPSEUDO_014039 [Phytophthora pseudosyringae]|uniref:Uncharacterized protein n=1 Tax=Phytophthora pseudosyringae TaxID=221518 RepID=A0A8T1W1M6_9STRA|nr:hypothetical protein PHYPSEUDO_014039 [Phytophthora pseudosyringae]
MPDNASSCFAGSCCASCCAGGGTSTNDNHRRRLAADDPRRRDYDISRDVTVQPVVMSQIRPPQPQCKKLEGEASNEFKTQASNKVKATMCGPDDGPGMDMCCGDECCGCLAGLCCASCCLAGASAGNNDRRDRRGHDSPSLREVYVQPVVVQQGYAHPPPPGYGPPPPGYGPPPPPPRRDYY